MVDLARYDWNLSISAEILAINQEIRNKQEKSYTKVDFNHARQSVIPIKALTPLSLKLNQQFSGNACQNLLTLHYKTQAI